MRPARQEDAEKFTSWYTSTETFNPEIFQYPETYTLCAFNREKLLGFLIARFDDEVQILDRFIPNPESSELEKALASSELVKAAITFGFIRGIPHIYFVGNNLGTNRIASRIFKLLPDADPGLFGSDYPVYRLTLKDLEWDF